MSAVRCPACGASNAFGAQWCGQCLARFADDSGPATTPADAPASPAASGAAAQLHAVEQAGIYRQGETLLWRCPVCDSDNAIEHTTCPVCHAPMASLFVATRPALKRQGPTAVWLSMAMPGAGHLWAGRGADAFGRLVLWVWTVSVGLLLVTRSGSEGAGVFRAIGFVFLIAATGVWIVSLVESQRLSKGDAATMIPGRALLWATVALTLVLFIGLAVGARAR